MRRRMSTIIDRLLENEQCQHIPDWLLKMEEQDIIMEELVNEL